jgi:alpha-galactosidase
VLAGDPDTTADDIALGLWMNPMEFNPASTAFKTNPQWACVPTGLATAIVNAAQPDDGSNEAGIGVWNPEALGLDPDTKTPVKFIDYLEGRIRREIDVYGARYFKFDFLVWADCVGVEPVDMYGYRDSFVAMWDRLQSDHPEVTFQIDETNDYRLFPFESVARGPSWFQNGSPASQQLLHNLWNLAPYVPGFSIGQAALGNRADRTARGIDYLMAVALGSHVTFWNDIDVGFTAAERAEVKRWTDFYKANRDELATFTYPLLSDPLKNNWAALQPWNPDAGRGYLLAYRQGAANASQSIPLRGIRGSGSFALTLVDPADGSSASLGTFTASALRAGLNVTLAQPYSYAIIQIQPA